MVSPRRASPGGGPQRPQPRVHPWARRSPMSRDAVRAPPRVAAHPRVAAARVRAALRRRPRRRPRRRVVHRARRPPRRLARARALYPTLHWESNASALPALDWNIPLDVVVVRRVRRPAQFLVNDPAYRRTAEGYATFGTPCAVCDERGALLCVFVTSAALPALERIADQARAALEEARRDLGPRTTFAVGSDYARDLLYRENAPREA